MRQYQTINNEKGIAVITALMILVILTLIGIAATNTTTIETQIASSEASLKQGFYKADAGISYAAENFTEADFKNKTPIWATPTESSNPRRDNPDPDLSDYSSSRILSHDIDSDGTDDFEIYYLSNVSSNNVEIFEIRSVSLPDKNGQGGNMIIDAEMQMPTVNTGELPGSGNQTDH